MVQGVGIRGTARVFEVDPNTVLQWLVEVADHAAAFTQYFLHDVRVTQVQLDQQFPLIAFESLPLVPLERSVDSLHLHLGYMPAV